MLSGKGGQGHVHRDFGVLGVIKKPCQPKLGNFWVVQPGCRMCQNHKLPSSSVRGRFWWGTAMPPSSRGTWSSMGALLMALTDCWSHRIWDLGVMSSPLLSCR